MRQIKFRVWDGKKLHYPEATKDEANHYLQFGTNGFWLFNEKGKMVTASEVSGECNQFIGVNDINKKEIYEGDIVRFQGNHNNHVVEYCTNGTVSFIFRNKKAVVYNVKGGVVEIVGNIYQNPELLAKDIEVEFNEIKK